jgi:hypothetical protein
MATARGEVLPDCTFLPKPLVRGLVLASAEGGVRLDGGEALDRSAGMEEGVGTHQQG